MKQVLLAAMAAAGLTMGSANLAEAGHDSPRVRFQVSFGNSGFGYGGYRGYGSGYRVHPYGYSPYRGSSGFHHGGHSGGRLIRHGCHYDYVPHGHYGVPVYTRPRYGYFGY